jgi:thioredoxin reductase (NADPH)
MNYVILYYKSVFNTTGVIIISDVLIIGGGPAGVTTALYTARGGLITTILYKDRGALQKAASVENFYGHIEINGEKLIEAGLEQARAVGVNVVNEEAVGISLNEDETFTIETENAAYTARAVVIATGANRAAPQISGLARLEGRGVSYCAVCDGFFHRGKDVAVIGNSVYALREAQDLLPIAKSVTVLTNGQAAAVKFPENIIVRTEKIEKVNEQESFTGPILKGVTLDGGEELVFSGLFIAVGVAGGTELARKLGAAIENNAVQTNKNMRATVANLWAAGDCAGGLKQIVKASYEGAVAGTDIVLTLRKEKIHE